MSEGRSKELHWLVRPETIRKLWIGSCLVLAITVLLNLAIHPHAVFGIEGTFGFYAWFGFAVCVAMILFAKGLGVFLKRMDAYYDD